MIKVFGRVVINSFRSNPEGMPTYRFIDRYNLQEYDRFFAELKTRILESTGNKVYAWFGITLFLASILFSFFNDKLDLIDPLSGFIISVLGFVFCVLLLFSRKQFIRFVFKYIVVNL